MEPKLFIKFIIFYIHRNLHNLDIGTQHFEKIISNKSSSSSQNHKDKNIKVYIFIGIVAIIILILILSVILYRSRLKKKIFEEIEKLYQEQKNNNDISQLPELHILRLKKEALNNTSRNFILNYNKKDFNSFLLKSEEKMETIRKKYGNELCISYLFAKNKIINNKYSSQLKQRFDDICTICLENFCLNIDICITPCEHIFHKKCLMKYLKSIKNKDKLKCPNCNQNLLINKIYLSIKNNQSDIKNTENFGGIENEAIEKSISVNHENNNEHDKKINKIEFCQAEVIEIYKKKQYSKNLEIDLNFSRRFNTFNEVKKEENNEELEKYRVI